MAFDFVIKGEGDIKKKVTGFLSKVKSRVSDHLSVVTKTARQNILDSVAQNRSRTPTPHKNPEHQRFNESWELLILRNSRAFRVPFFVGGIGLLEELRTKCPYYMRLNDGFLPPQAWGYFGEGSPPIAGAGGEYFTPAGAAAPGSQIYFMRPKKEFPGLHYLENTHLKTDTNIRTLTRKAR